MSEFALPIGLGLVGVGLWQAFVRARLPEPETARPGEGRELLGLFAMAWLVNFLALAFGFRALTGEPPVLEPDGGGTAPSLIETAGLDGVLAVQAGANALAVVALLALVARLGRGHAGIGLERTRAPVLLASVAAWLGFLPVLAASAWLNAELIRRFGDGEDMQAYLSAFLESTELRGSLLVWAAMVVVIPLAEEVLYRGALYSGLRALVGVPGAALLSGLAFGLQHDSAAMLPTCALGVMLAWLRERTGSLAAPVVVHVLQNGFTLALASLAPESLGTP